ncbi:MAG: hypothetical protein LKF61_02475 [Eggerthellaceae bacterium]|jgi:hypothetical protein|nr:hypothetical protein [Eggerthellaceae bacterium]MCH4221138.1 hypothetical protein [Eggerthellaceae bacterium]
MARKQDQYDWLDDPFDDKKKTLSKGMSTSSKVAVVIGCIVVIFIIFLLAVLVLANSVAIINA